MSAQKTSNDRLMSEAFGQTIRDNRHDSNEYASKTMARFTVLLVAFVVMLIVFMFCN